MSATGTTSTGPAGSTGGEPAVPRLVAVWVPDWPVVALTLEARDSQRLRARTGTAGHRAGQEIPDPAIVPVAVVGGRGVVAASAPARAVGVRAGMSLRVSRFLCPELVTLPPQPEREARAFETVMEALSALLADPLVVRPGLAVCGARGPARWAGGEEELAAALVEAVAQGPGVECQVGAADSLLGAVLAARRGILMAPGVTPGFLAPRPLGAVLLALPTRRSRQEARELLETFARLGLLTLGDLAALPRRDVAARFGPLGESLHRLASGGSTEVPHSTRPASDIRVEMSLDPPVERTDTAAFAARRLSEDLAARLVSHGLAAGRLLVEAGCDNGAELARSWLLETTPTPAELTDRVRWQLEGWLSGRSGRPPTAPLTSLRLSALELVPAGTSQAGLWTTPGEQGVRRAHRAAERVESLLGVGGVQVPLLAAGRDPRSRLRLLTWGEQDLQAGGTASASGTDAPWAGSLPQPSPSLVPPCPVPAVLTGASGQDVGVTAQGQLDAVPAVLTIPPASSTTQGHADAPGGSSTDGWIDAPGSPAEAGVPGGTGDVCGWLAELGGGEERRVLAWAGPWPVDEGWWRPTGGSRRAYLQVLTDHGPPLLLVRAGRWWVEGVYS